MYLHITYNSYIIYVCIIYNTVLFIIYDSIIYILDIHTNSLTRTHTYMYMYNDFSL